MTWPRRFVAVGLVLAVIAGGVYVTRGTVQSELHKSGLCAPQADAQIDGLYAASSGYYYIAGDEDRLLVRKLFGGASEKTVNNSSYHGGVYRVSWTEAEDERVRVLLSDDMAVIDDDGGIMEMMHQVDSCDGLEDRLVDAFVKWRGDSRD